MAVSSIERKLCVALTLVVSSSLVLSTTVPARAVSNEFYDARQAKVHYYETPVRSAFNCASLAGQKIDEATRIRVASVVAPTAVTPAFCDVKGVIGRSIAIEVAMPLAWNQRLYVFGNGGFAGESLEGPDRIAQRDVALENGFAVAQTDTGHQGNALGVLDGSWAANRPDLVVDYAYEAIHETNVEAKKLVKIFYSGRGALHSYFNGCSDGGREAYEEAQKFPNDFDGIVGAAVFAAGIDTNIDGLWVLQHLLPLNFTVGKFATIGAADVAKCDALDGDVDGIIGDPRRCDFNVKRDVPRCIGASTDSCLTEAEADAYDKGVLGPVLSNGHPYFPRYPSGPEADYGFVGIFLPYVMNGQLLSPAVGKVFAEQFTRYIFPFPRTDTGEYTIRNFNFDTGPQQVIGARRVLDALTPDISPFLRHGGKMITYTGWADPLINPYASVGYYENVLSTLGRGVESSFRLFMVPGVHHCSGGPGPDAIDAMTPLIDWTEAHIAPPQMVAHKFAPKGALMPNFTRKLCAYPYEARYLGTAYPLNNAASYTCVEGLHGTEAGLKRGVPDTPIHE